MKTSYISFFWGRNEPSDYIPRFNANTDKHIRHLFSTDKSSLNYSKQSDFSNVKPKEYYDSETEDDSILHI